MSFEHTRGDLLVLVAAMIWGIAFYFQKTAMLHIGPFLFIGLRSAVAAVSLLPFAAAEQAKAGGNRRGAVRFGILGGAVFFVAASVQQFGIVTATVTNTGFLTALYVVATPLVFWAVRRVRPSGIVWLAVALSISGTWALAGGSIGGFGTGDVLVAAAAAIWALQIVITGESGRFAQPLTYTCIQFSVVTVLALACAFAWEPVDADAIAAAAGSILYVGVLSSAFTFAVMAMALRHVPAPRAAVLLSVETLFSAGAGAVLLGERLAPLGWVGAALILGAILVVRRRAD